MPIAGYEALVRRSGLATAVTVEPLQLNPSGQSTQFRITDSAKRVIDPNADFHFQNGTTTIAYTTISSLDLLNGIVTFSGAQTAGSVTSLSFYGNYLPLTTASEVVLDCRSFKIGLSRNPMDTTSLTGDSSAFVRKRLMGLKDASVDVETIADVAQLGVLTNTAAFAGEHVVVEVSFGGNAATNPKFRGITRVQDISIDGSNDDLVKTSISFKMSQAPTIPAGFSATYGFVIQP